MAALAMDLIIAIASLAPSLVGATIEFDPARLAASDLDAAFFAESVLTAVLAADFFGRTSFPPEFPEAADFAEDRAFTAEGRAAAGFDVAISTGRGLPAVAFVAAEFAGIASLAAAVFFADMDFRGADPTFAALVASWPLADTDLPAAGFTCRGLAPLDFLMETLDLDAD